MTRSGLRPAAAKAAILATPNGIAEAREAVIQAAAAQRRIAHPSVPAVGRGGALYWAEGFKTERRTWSWRTADRGSPAVVMRWSRRHPRAYRWSSVARTQSSRRQRREQQPCRYWSIELVVPAAHLTKTFIKPDGNRPPTKPSRSMESFVCRAPRKSTDHVVRTIGLDSGAVHARLDVTQRTTVSLIVGR